MEELVKIHENKHGHRVVSGRDLHEFLGSKQEFSNWIKNRIERYGFIEWEDYTSFDKVIKRENGSTVRKEFALSIDMAKEISMVEGNEKGKLVRKYFIECEAQAKREVMHSIPQTFAQALKLAAEQAEQIEVQQRQIQEMEPKAKAAEIMLLSDDSISVADFAKSIGTGQNRLFKRLKQEGYLIEKKNTPYQRYIDAGYFVVKEITKTADNKIKLFHQTRITPQGQVYLTSKLL